MTTTTTQFFIHSTTGTVHVAGTCTRNRGGRAIAPTAVATEVVIEHADTLKFCKRCQAGARFAEVTR